VVVAIADEQPAPGIERERVRLIELAATAAGLPPPLDQLSVFRKLQDLGLALTMTLRDEDVAVFGNDHIVRLKEVLRIDAAARLAESHQKLAFRAELEDLMPF